MYNIILYIIVLAAADDDDDGLCTTSYLYAAYSTPAGTVTPLGFTPEIIKKKDNRNTHIHRNVHIKNMDIDSVFWTVLRSVKKKNHN